MKRVRTRLSGTSSLFHGCRGRGTRPRSPRTRWAPSRLPTCRLTRVGPDALRADEICSQHGRPPREVITTMVSQLAEGCASCERTHPEPPLWFFQLGSSCSNRPADQMDGECTEDQPVDGDRAPPEGVESARNDARDGDRSAYRVGDGDRYGGRALCARVGSTQEPTDDAEPDQRCAEEAR